MESPLDHVAREEKRLEELFWVASGGGLFALLRQVPRSAVRDAIRRGSVRPIVAHWEALLRDAELDLARLTAPVASYGYRLGFGDVPRFDASRSLINRLATAAANERAAQSLRLVRQATQQNLRRMIVNAGRRYDRNPSRRLLETLAEQILLKIGLTTPQAQQIERRARELGVQGASERELADLVRTRSDSALGIRAAAVAGFVAVATVSFPRLGAWQHMQSDGVLSASARKHWRFIGDGRARRPHVQQGLMGPVPIGQPYPVFGVMAPPAPEAGCRCWHELVGS